MCHNQPTIELNRKECSVARRPPLLRSINWALLIGTLGGALYGAFQAAWLLGGGWSLFGAVVGALLGVVASGDLLIPGPPPEIATPGERGQRMGPLRGGALLLLLAVEGLIIGAYLWGTVTLSCQRAATPTTTERSTITCQRTAFGWLNQRQTSVTIYEQVTAVGLDVHNELLLQHGEFQQSQSVAGFSRTAQTQVQTFVRSSAPALRLTANDGWLRWGAPICWLLALGGGLWALFQLRHGWETLRQQLAIGEIYWGWRAKSALTAQDSLQNSTWLRDDKC